MTRFILVPLAAIAFLGACDATDPVAVRPIEDGIPAPHFSIDARWAIADTGTTGPGSTYAVFVPANWNGDAVFYAHGFNDVSDPVALPVKEQAQALRDRLGDMGFAVAYSSYSENGYALKDGVQRTHQLRGLLAARTGAVPDRSYLVGHSLGGLVALTLAETHPDQYDGALPMCGVVGGTALQVSYIGNVRLLFDWFYPGVLPGSVVDMPADLNLTADVILPALAAIQARPDKAFALTQVAQAPVPFANGTELATGLLSAIGFHARGMNDLLERTHGQVLFDNATTVYSTANPAIAPLMPLINDPVIGVPRYTATAAAANYVEKYYEPTGALRIPVLSMHTTRDPAVPVQHQRQLAARAAAAGASEFLRTREIPAFGHCAFTMDQVTQAFTELVSWVESGS